MALLLATGLAVTDQRPDTTVPGLVLAATVQLESENNETVVASVCVPVPLTVGVVLCEGETGLVVELTAGRVEVKLAGEGVQAETLPTVSVAVA